MGLISTPAIALSGLRIGESDMLVTFYTLRFGKVKGALKGVLKGRSPLSGRSEPFIYSNVIFFKSKKSNIHRVNSIDVIDPFLKLKSDLPRLLKAFIAIELVSISQAEFMPDKNIFYELSKLLKLLSSNSDRQLELALRIFQIRLLHYSGLISKLSECSTCSRAIQNSSDLFISVNSATIICGNCHNRNATLIKISRGATMLIQKIISYSFEKLGRLFASGDSLNEIALLIEQILKQNFSKILRSETMMGQMINSDNNFINKS
ncbi:MAG: DNA repair protein RecO [Nitrospinota bacterium]